MGQCYGFGYGNGWGQSKINSDVNLAQQTFLENELKMMKEQVAKVEKELADLNKLNSNSSIKDEE